MTAAEAFRCDTENLVINRNLHSNNASENNLERRDTQKFRKHLFTLPLLIA